MHYMQAACRVGVSFREASPSCPKMKGGFTPHSWLDFTRGFFSVDNGRVCVCLIMYHGSNQPTGWDRCNSLSLSCMEGPSLAVKRCPSSRPIHATSARIRCRASAVIEHHTMRRQVQADHILEEPQVILSANNRSSSAAAAAAAAATKLSSSAISTASSGQNTHHIAAAQMP